MKLFDRKHYAAMPVLLALSLVGGVSEAQAALVLDVKFGAAAFMPTLDKARELARAMVALGAGCGVKTRALLSRMDVPLGRAAGNWLEVKEAVACLNPEAGPGSDSRATGNAPAPSEPADLRELVLACAAHLLVQTGKANRLAPARRAAACLRAGCASRARRGRPAPDNRAR